jgi:CTP:phosphocholine cytidylyltransferase-like protein
MEVNDMKKKELIEEIIQRLREMDITDISIVLTFINNL